MLKIQIILGSVRQNRFGDKPAQWIYGEVEKLEGVKAELIDLRDYPLPFFNDPASPAMLKSNYSNEVARQWVKKVGEADRYVIVTPE